jgi:mannose-6-phosphate isomerase-like protein (cupin superfamily)
LYIYLSSSPTRTQILGQEWSAPVSLQSLAPPTDHSPSLASPVVGSDTSYYVHPVTHRLENIGDRLTRSIVVLNETRGDESGTTAETAGFKWKAELINRWFRAYRQTLASGTSAGPHRHHAPVVLVQTSVGRGLASGAARFELNEPGQWAFFDAGDTHEIRNTGDVPLEVVEVELRQPKLKN